MLNIRGLKFGEKEFLHLDKNINPAYFGHVFLLKNNAWVIDHPIRNVDEILKMLENHRYHLDPSTI